MASRFYNCICGRFATINMFEWIMREQKIECQCGRVLGVNDSLFGFSLDTAHYAWNRYMKREMLKLERVKHGTRPNRNIQM